MNKKKILIADDDPNILQLLNVNLRSDKYDVISCINGETALEKIKEERPDLVILDIMMPRIDGYTLDLELKDESETKDIPVIIITGMSDTKRLFDNTESARFIAWFEKPLEINKLVDCVNGYFHGSKKSQKGKK
ncbi:MAG: hypothetical protein A2474_02540 [Elusimicrobia bacterium RIFOXYC2_FULL_34_12]|nr:MAG: hypothetical protein A2474_02540 [Elusimicrobia bacterium RIFOXYC2_FULL_34_12]OGS39016.1 MAG: hypothetical protein A2551_07275 [Elusimicrobia bacterium RIFOXYD2_FULL_34_30]HAM39677.1 response regulator [Elusimicrobiota bacterium]